MMSGILPVVIEITGLTAVESHEAVIWIEQQPLHEETNDGVASPPVRTVLVRTAGNVVVKVFL